MGQAPRSETTVDDFSTRSISPVTLRSIAYVELGGLDGVTYSNSHLFHHGLDWKGVLIEVNPKSFAALQVNRPNDDTFNFAVCSESSEVTFIDSGDGAVTGMLEFMAPSFVSAYLSLIHI